MTAPDSVIALAEERAQAKAAKDFARADQLRNQIAESGWVVTDTASGFELTPRPPFDLIDNVDALKQQQTPTDVSVGVIVDGWWSDIEVCLDAIVTHTDAFIYALDVSGDVEVSTALAEYAKAHSNRIADLHVANDPGWGRSARRLAELSTADFHVLLDPSSVLTGDALSQMRDAFTGSEVVGVGWKGALVDLDDNWRSVTDKGPGEVDVLLGYLMMVRRSALLATEYPHPKARFYRNADLELSLGLRAQGGRLLALDLPVEQRRHHGYHDSEPEMRAKESKRTYDRLLQSFRGREEILAPRRP
jgi:hypothetical protein